MNNTNRSTTGDMPTEFFSNDFFSLARNLGGPSVLILRDPRSGGDAAEICSRSGFRVFLDLEHALTELQKGRAVAIFAGPDDLNQLEQMMIQEAFEKAGLDRGGNLLIILAEGDLASLRADSPLYGVEGPVAYYSEREQRVEMVN